MTPNNKQTECKHEYHEIRLPECDIYCEDCGTKLNVSRGKIRIPLSFPQQTEWTSKEFDMPKGTPRIAKVITTPQQTEDWETHITYKALTTPSIK